MTHDVKATFSLDVRPTQVRSVLVLQPSSHAHLETLHRRISGDARCAAQVAAVACSVARRVRLTNAAMMAVLGGDFRASEDASHSGAKLDHA